MQKLLQRPVQGNEETIQGPTLDFLRRCLECGRTLNRKTNQRYRYVESGLKNVWLDGVVVHHCRHCHEQYSEIPNVNRIHDLIALAITEKRFALVGAELRFLRKHMRMKAKELAAVLGVTTTTISRWETGAERVGSSNDRLMRCLYMFWRLKRRDVHDPPRLFERIQSDFQRLSPRPRAEQITITIDN